MSVSTQQNHGSETITSGVRVRVRPKYLPQHSGGERGKWVFGYDVEFTNESEREIKIVSREWLIVDADGEKHDVRGEGVVGVQPTIDPGEMFEYASFCPLETPWGTMEGCFHAICGESGELIEIRAARFYLVSEEPD